MLNDVVAARRMVRPLDLVAIAVATLALSIHFYHPYYFGDELFSFNFGEQAGNTLMGVFNGLNSYKPRMVMNFLWAVIVSQDLPRWIPMIVNAAALAGCAALVYSMARVYFNARRLPALLAAAMMVACRFNIMLYFDYVSGTVEAISLLFLLAGTALAARSLLFVQRQCRPRRRYRALVPAGCRGWRRPVAGRRGRACTACRGPAAAIGAGASAGNPPAAARMPSPVAGRDARGAIQVGDSAGILSALSQIGQGGLGGRWGAAIRMQRLRFHLRTLGGSWPLIPGIRPEISSGLLAPGARVGPRPGVWRFTCVLGRGVLAASAWGLITEHDVWKATTSAGPPTDQAECRTGSGGAGSDAADHLPDPCGALVPSTF